MDNVSKIQDGTAIAAMIVLTTVKGGHIVNGKFWLPNGGISRN
jgi:hypothetical protein